MRIDLSGRVAIVTGAGGGLGRSHALALARRGAQVVVNDMPDDQGGSSVGAREVVAEIEAQGGQALALPASVSDAQAVQQMVETVLQHWGRVDIAVNNAGILRDKSFAKMTLAEFREVLDVHLMGSVHLCKAVWEPMRAQQHGRIILTTSSSGLWGNFGQANYGAAKMALVGLMQTLAIEGEKYGIRANALAPTAATRMTQGLLPEAALARLKPELVSAAVVFLASDGAPNKRILCAGAGSFECSHISLTAGLRLGEGDEAADVLAARFDEVWDRDGELLPVTGFDQARYEVFRP
jgi:NAD(P)-dependent dehydrogenase (short-subunit alcohol dehydrogenase family)